MTNSHGSPDCTSIYEQRIHNFELESVVVEEQAQFRIGCMRRLHGRRKVVWSDYVAAVRSH